MQNGELVLEEVRLLLQVKVEQTMTLERSTSAAPGERPGRIAERDENGLFSADRAGV
jgi:hypothetical protein